MKFFKNRQTPNSQNADQFIEKCFTELQQQTPRQHEKWNLATSSYDVDLHAGKIYFTSPDKKKLEADIQVVGTYNTLDGSFMWGWDHPSVPEGLQKTARAAKEWGMQNMQDIFLAHVVNVPENMAWFFLGVALKLSNADTVYRAKLGTTYVYLTLHDIRKHLQ